MVVTDVCSVLFCLFVGLLAFQIYDHDVKFCAFDVDVDVAVNDIAPPLMWAVIRLLLAGMPTQRKHVAMAGRFRKRRTKRFKNSC